ncbi:MAG: multidrug effflux MFS transporter [Rhodospirillales bacterium]
MAQGAQRQYLFLITLVAITLLGPLTVHTFLPAMPAIQKDFAVSMALAQAGLSLAVATMACTTIVYGTLSDRLGRRPVLIAGLSLFACGVAVSAAAPTMTAFLVGRVLQAAGAGCGVVLARAMLRDAFGDAKLAKYFAYLTAAYVLGPMLGPVLGGFLMDAYGWRAMFLLALAVGLAILGLVVWRLPETHLKRTRFLGFRSLARDYGLLLRSSRFLGYTMHTAFSTGGFYALISAAAFLIGDVLGESASTFGLYFILLPLGFMVGNFVSGRLVGRVAGHRMVMIGASLAVVVVLGHASLLFSGPMTAMTLLAPGALMTFTQGLSIPNAQAGAIAGDPRLTGTASGLLVFLQMATAGVFSQIVGIWSDGTFVPMLALLFLGNFLALLAAAWGAYARPQSR